MTAQRALLALIVVAAAALSLASAAAQSYPLAALTLALGAIWLIAEARAQRRPGTILFLALLALAVAASLNDAPILIVLVSLSADLAAWDLSRLQARIADGCEGATRAALEASHLRKLAVTACAGLLIALLPALIQISLSFVAVCVLILLAMFVLRRSLLTLRRES